MSKRFRLGIMDKILIGAAAINIGWMAGFFGFVKKNNPHVRPYVEKNLTSIMKIQEEKFEIKHFGIPEMSFETPEEYMLGFDGAYSAGGDTIYISSSPKITPELNATNILMKFFSLGEVRNIDEILNHELGHFYADKLGESLGMENWPDYNTLNKQNGCFTCIKLISEGIAEYFRRSIKCGEDSSNSDCQLRDLKEFSIYDNDSTNFIYSGGYYLVKPIIDTYGKKGIEYLITHIPGANDLLELEKYQKRTMDELAVRENIK